MNTTTKRGRIARLTAILIATVILMSLTCVLAERSEAASGKTLIVYFSRTGTTAKVAKKIRKLTGAKIVRLRTKRTYPTDYDKMLEAAEKEQDENARPALKTTIKYFKRYKKIILGYPIWHGLQPMAINTFLEKYDFKGKTVIPFCTSGGSGIYDSVVSIRRVCKAATIGKGIDATDVGNKRLKKWLKNNKVALKSNVPKVTLKIGKKNVTKKTYTLKQGKKARIKAKLSKVKGKRKVTFRSGNKKIAVVSKKGIVRAKKAGKAKIRVTVKVKKKKYKSWVTIKVPKKAA